MDSHAHLQHAWFDHDRDEVIARAAEAGIERILVPGWDVPSSEAALELATLDAPLVEAARSPFEALATPGHSTDHVCFLSGGLCFCGDLVLGAGSSFVPPDGGSLGAYLDSLRLLRSREPLLLCPGHGPYITEPAARIDGYLAHRLERERKLLAALEAGERSRVRLLDAAWDDVPAELRPAAEIVMQAHLDKLEAEGRVRARELVD